MGSPWEMFPPSPGARGSASALQFRERGRWNGAHLLKLRRVEEMARKRMNAEAYTVVAQLHQSRARAHPEHAALGVNGYYKRLL